MNRAPALPRPRRTRSLIPPGDPHNLALSTETRKLKRVRDGTLGQDVSLPPARVASIQFCELPPWTPGIAVPGSNPGTPRLKPRGSAMAQKTRWGKVARSALARSAVVLTCFLALSGCRHGPSRQSTRAATIAHTRSGCSHGRDACNIPAPAQDAQSVQPRGGRLRPGPLPSWLWRRLFHPAHLMPCRRAPASLGSATARPPSWTLSTAA